LWGDFSLSGKRVEVQASEVEEDVRLESLPVPGAIVVLDRGYTDDGLFGRWARQGVLFVPRMGSNAQYEVFHTIPGKTQVWTTWIAMLLLKFLQRKSSWIWSLSNMA